MFRLNMVGLFLYSLGLILFIVFGYIFIREIKSMKKVEEIDEKRYKNFNIVYGIYIALFVLYPILCIFFPSIDLLSRRKISLIIYFVIIPILFGVLLGISLLIVPKQYIEETSDTYLLYIIGVLFAGISLIMINLQTICDVRRIFLDTNLFTSIDNEP